MAMHLPITLIGHLCSVITDSLNMNESHLHSFVFSIPNYLPPYLSAGLQSFENNYEVGQFKIINRKRFCLMQNKERNSISLSIAAYYKMIKMAEHGQGHMTRSGKVAK